MKNFLFSLFLLTSVFGFSQQLQGFQTIYSLKTTSVKNQQRTGCCWAFATVSLIETEAIRKTNKVFDLSEMYVVYYAYIQKGIEYIRWSGKTQFSQGGLAHDVINIVKEYGIVPENDYPFEVTDHYQLEQDLKYYLDSIVKMRYIPDDWLDGYKQILHKTLPPPPQKINYHGKTMTPKAFLFNVLKFDPNQYVEFTSFTHRNYYYPFVLEVPDNWSKGLFWNVPINQLYEIVENSLKMGYSVVWDADVSEKGFNIRNGTATLTDEQKQQISKKGFAKFRQNTYQRHLTTDDHLMHIVGMAKKDNQEYFIVKNSWGNVGKAKGYLYVSKDYFMAKTISILVHKDVIPNEIKERLYKFDCE